MCVHTQYSCISSPLPHMPKKNKKQKQKPHIQRHRSRFFTVSSQHRKLSPTCTLKRPGCNRVQITFNTSSAYHMQHVVLRAAQYEGTAQLLSLTEMKSHLFELCFIGWNINRWGRGGNQSTWRKPLVTSFRKCHILKPNGSSPKQDSNLHNSVGGRLGKQTCSPLHHASPPPPPPPPKKKKNTDQQMSR